MTRWWDTGIRRLWAGERGAAVLARASLTLADTQKTVKEWIQKMW